MVPWCSIGAFPAHPANVVALAAAVVAAMIVAAVVTLRKNHDR